MRHYHGRDADKLIDISDDVTQGRIQLFDLTPTDLKQFVDQFDPLYVDSTQQGRVGPCGGSNDNQDIVEYPRQRSRSATTCR